MISPFGERHSAWHIYAGFNEIYNTGQRGSESAETIEPVELDWLSRNAQNDNWFLHLNLWDPHTPYRVPASFGNPFAEEPLPAWLTDSLTFCKMRRQPNYLLRPSRFCETNGSITNAI